MVNQPSVADTMLILKGLRDKYEEHHKVKITDEGCNQTFGQIYYRQVFAG